MLATLLSAVLSEPSASEMCSNCKVKAASGASEVPPQALSTKAVANTVDHNFLPIVFDMHDPNVFTKESV
jgi:hypothetical protein